MKNKWKKLCAQILTVSMALWCMAADAPLLSATEVADEENMPTQLSTDEEAIPMQLIVEETVAGVGEDAQWSTMKRSYAKNEKLQATKDKIGKEKRNITVAVLDSGVAPDGEYLQGRVLPSIDGADGDANGHGTLMAQIVAMQTPEQVKILPIQVVDAQGRGTVGSVCEGIRLACEHGADIILLSLAGEGTSKMLSEAIVAARAGGTHVVVAAGNDGADVKEYLPGNIAEATTISAVDDHGYIADYSNYGDTIDYCAKGSFLSEGLLHQGTSIAAANATAAFALALSEGCGEETVWRTMAEDFGASGWDCLYGFGCVDAARWQELLEDTNRENDENDNREQEDNEKGDIDTEEGIDDTDSGDAEDEKKIDDNTEDEKKEDDENVIDPTVCVQETIYQDQTINLYGNTNMYASKKVAPNVHVVVNGNGYGYVNQIENPILEQNVCFYVASGGTLTLNHVVINANGGGDASNSFLRTRSGVSVDVGGTLILNDCIIYGSGVEGHGILALAGSTCTITGGSVSKCYGGGVYTLGNYKIKNFQVSKCKSTGLTTAGAGTIDGCQCLSCDIGLQTLGGSIKAKNLTCNNNQIGLHNSATMSLSEGTIQKNQQDGIQNVGELTINGATISANKRYGIYNVSSGSVLLATATIKGNTSYDVYHAGVACVMRKQADISGKGIYLCKNAYVKVEQMLAAAKGSIKLTLDEKNLKPGAICIDNLTKNTTQEVMNCFRLQNNHTATKTKEVMKNGLKNRVAVLRVGNGVNGGKKTQVVLSEEYYVSFQGNVTNAHVTYTLPEKKTVYWKEKASVPTGKAKLYYDGRELLSLQHTGWSRTKNAETNVCAPEEKQVYQPEEVTKDLVLYTTFNAVAQLVVKGNKQTTGEDFVVPGFISGKTPLPTNRFTREGASYQGWSYAKDTTYKQAGIMHPGEKLDFTKKIINQLNKGTEKVDVNGYMSIVIYAIWDAFPTLETEEVYTTVSEVETGAFTEDDVLASVEANDLEDGKQLKMVILNFDKAELVSLGTLGSTTVTCKVTDGVGNETYATVTIHVATDGIYQGKYVEENKAFCRFVDQENYEKVEEASGALQQESIWYKDETLAQRLEADYVKANGTGYQKRYIFSADDVLKSQAYVREHGPGNYTGEDNLSFYATSVLASAKK